ncbi:hypothetical protein EB809_08145 [Marinobacter sp. R17]|nr:hypothetical protein EB809_08145 [Marinobacter sp. R17]
MPVTLRAHIAALLSLLLLLSGPASAASLMTGLPTGASQTDCGAASMATSQSVVHQHAASGTANQGVACAKVAGKVCPNPASMGQCVVLFMLGPSHKLPTPELAVRSVFPQPGSDYQNPDLTITTPPPQTLV